VIQHLKSFNALEQGLTVVTIGGNWIIGKIEFSELFKLSQRFQAVKVLDMVLGRKDLIESGIVD